MAKEIERKWIVDPKVVEGLDYETSEGRVVKFINQGYISFEPEIRIRKVCTDTVTSSLMTLDTKYYLTIKSSGDLFREEDESEISEDTYRDLLGHIKGSLITKTRFLVNLEGKYTAEIDVYGSDIDNDKFCVVEVEFPDLISAEEFRAPSWFGLEVTKDPMYKNKNIAMYGLLFIKY